MKILTFSILITSLILLEPVFANPLPAAESPTNIEEISIPPPRPYAIKRGPGPEAYPEPIPPPRPFRVVLPTEIPVTPTGGPFKAIRAAEPQPVPTPAPLPVPILARNRHHAITLPDYSPNEGDLRKLRSRANIMKLNYYSDASCTSWVNSVNVNSVLDNVCVSYYIPNGWSANIANCYADDCLARFYPNTNCAWSPFGTADTRGSNCVRSKPEPGEWQYFRSFRGLAIWYGAREAETPVEVDGVDRKGNATVIEVRTSNGHGGGH